MKCKTKALEGRNIILFIELINTSCFQTCIDIFHKRRIDWIKINFILLRNTVENVLEKLCETRLVEQK